MWLIDYIQFQPSILNFSYPSRQISNPMALTSPTTTTHLSKSLSLMHHLRSKTFRTVSASTHFTDPQKIHSFGFKSLKLSAKMGSLTQGKQVHAQLVKLGLCNVLSLGNRVLNFYVKCKQFKDACILFDEMPVGNLVTWNMLICGIVSRGWSCDSSVYMGFYYFRRMLMDEVWPDSITLNSMIRVCIEVNDVDAGKLLHCLVVKLGFELDSFVNSALVELYGKCRLVEKARRVFDGVLYRDVVLWNVMVYCYALNSLGEEAFKVFKLMQLENLIGDAFTFSSLLNSCGSLESCDLGLQIHSLVIKLSFDSDVFVASGLVHAYAKSENIDAARKAFDMAMARNSVCWNTMIVAYGQNGDGKEAMNLLLMMFREDFIPDELTLASILSSSGSVSACNEILQVHAYIVKNGFEAFLSIANGLINAYSKGGNLSSAIQCFRTVSNPDLVTWTSIISAYAFHGLPQQSIEVFEEMLANGLIPDRISFLAVLSSCSHAGLISKGLHYFNLMTKDYQILPDGEHYTCLVDLLGRAGLLDEAYNILTLTPVKLGSDTLGAFTGACKIHRNVKLAKWAAEKLFELEPNEPVNYTLMSNMYASEGHWQDVARVRKLMRNRCDHKIPGCSWIELFGTVHAFSSSDKSHPQALDIYGMLRSVLRPGKEKLFISFHDIVLGE